MSCNCIQEMNDVLREHLNDPEASINVGFSISDNKIDIKPSGLAVTYRERKKDGTYLLKRKQRTLVPTFCPWCGKKYSNEDTCSNQEVEEAKN